MAEIRHTVSEELLKRFEFIVDTAKEFMSLINKNYTYEAVNDSYCRAHNKNREEIASTAHEFSHLKAEDIGRVLCGKQMYIKEVTKSTHNGKEMIAEVVIVRKGK